MIGQRSLNISMLSRLTLHASIFDRFNLFNNKYENDINNKTTYSNNTEHVTKINRFTMFNTLDVARGGLEVIKAFQQLIYIYTNN